MNNHPYTLKTTRVTIPILLSVAFSLLVSATISATTFVPPRNFAELAQQGQVVVVAVAGATGMTKNTDTPSKMTEMTVTRLISVGNLLNPGDTIGIVVPGGDNGVVRWVVDGSPTFVSGQTYLLVLNQAKAGHWRPIALAMGILQLVDEGDGQRFWQPLPEYRKMTVLSRLDGEAVENLGAFDETALVDHLTDVLAGKTAWNLGVVEANFGEPSQTDAERTAPTSCQYLGQTEGTPMRWKLFDSKGTVSIYASTGGDSSLSTRGTTELSDALSQWQAVPGTNIKLRYAGEKSYALTCSGGEDYPKPGDNVVVFNDPCEDIPDLKNGTGVYSMGGAYASGSHTYDGRTWYSIMSLFAVINNGAGILGPDAYRKMLTHEIGHGLGFDHSSDSKSLMYPNCCNGMSQADMTCSQYLYAANGAKAPTSPTSVAASDSAYTEFVRVSWAVATGASSYSIWRRLAAGGQAAQVGSSSTTTYDDSSAQPGVTYAYSLKATNTFGTSTASSEDAGMRACMTPAAPAPSAPSPVVSGATYTVSWPIIGGTVNYDVDEAENASFSGATRRTVTDASASFSHTASTSKTYYYRVVAQCACGANTVPSPTSSPISVAISPVASGNAIYLPSASHANGANGTEWRTDVAIFNPGNSAVLFTIELLKQDADNSHPQAVSYTLPANSGTTFKDVISSAFATSGSAALRIAAAGANLVASANTYNATSQGTYGQLIQASPTSTAIPFGENRRIFPLASASSRDHGFRSNLGFVNVGSTVIKIEVELHRFTGELLATKRYDVKAYSFIQACDILAGLGGGELESAFAIVRTLTSGGRFLAFASVVDNRSGDPLYLIAQ